MESNINEGETPETGFDSSGLVKYVYQKVTGRVLPHYIGNLLNMGKKVDRNELKPGDLVFPIYSHVGIYVGNGKIIHAPNPGKSVQIVNTYSFATARRIL